MRRVFLTLCLLAPLLLSPARAGDAPALLLRGLDGQEAALSYDDIAALPRQRIEIEQHGARRVFEGPLLGDLLEKVGAPRGKAIRGPHMADVVLARASDGYVVALGLAGTDASTRPERVIVALAMDGAPIAGEDGPLRLVVEGDLRPARAVRMLTSLSLVRPQ